MKNSVKPETASSLSQTAIPKDIQLDADRGLKFAAGWALRTLEELARQEARRTNSTFELCDYTAAKALRDALAPNPITQATASPKERNSREVFDAGFCSHQPESVSSSDISSTLAEIQQKQDGRRAETEKDAEYIADIDTLLGIIDSLNRQILLAKKLEAAPHECSKES